MRVLLFARAKDLAGTECVELDAPATVGELRLRLAERCPGLAGILAKSVIAVNNEFVGDDTRIPQDAEVALLPPVSGG